MTGLALNGSATNDTGTGGVGKAFIDNPAGRRALYGIVGVLSILCNSALCTVIFKKKSMLRNSYNVLVLVLAIVDTTTGFFVIISPSFVIGNEVMPIPSGGMGRAFCFLIQRNFFVWLLAKYSISIAMCMAIERWYALARPAKYKVLFSTQKVLVYAALLFCVTLVVTMPTFFQTFSEDKGSETICVDRPLMGMMLASQVFTVIYCIITVFAPFLVIAVTYFHLKFYIIGQQSPPQTQTQKSRRQVEIMLSRMSAAIALVLLICIFPSQVTFILFNFNLTSWDVVNVSSTWSMFNSVANPFIYCLTNKVYRKEFAQLFCPCKDSGVMAVGAEECDDTATTNGATFQLSSEAVRKEGINPTVLSITKES